MVMAYEIIDTYNRTGIGNGPTRETGINLQGHV